jgi:hypothetical protein
MILAELGYEGRGGLGELVGRVAAACEGVLAKHGRDWSPAYPVTLRELLTLGLQQQVLGGHPRPMDPGHDQGYHVWVVLPEGGVSAWCHDLAARLAAGCTGPASPKLALDLEQALVAEFRPCLRRSESLPNREEAGGALI